MEKGGVGEIYEVTSEKDYKKLDLKFMSTNLFRAFFVTEKIYS